MQRYHILVQGTKERFGSKILRRSVAHETLNVKILVWKGRGVGEWEY